MDEFASSLRPGPLSSEAEGDQELMELLDTTSPRLRTLRRGGVVEGFFVQITRDKILVDMGTKAEGVTPAFEAVVPAGELSSAAALGETIVAMVLDTEN